MKRSKPLQADPEKTRAWQQRSRRRLPHRSAKRAGEVNARREAVAAALARDKGCVGRKLVPSVACWGDLDGHEPLPRSRGGNHLDPEQIVMLCRGHHSWVHAHPALARDCGLLLR